MCDKGPHRDWGEMSDITLRFNEACIVLKTAYYQLSGWQDISDDEWSGAWKTMLKVVDELIQRERRSVYYNLYRSLCSEDMMQVAGLISLRAMLKYHLMNDEVIKQIDWLANMMSRYTSKLFHRDRAR